MNPLRTGTWNEKTQAREPYNVKRGSEVVIIDSLLLLSELGFPKSDCDLFCLSYSSVREQLLRWE